MIFICHRGKKTIEEPENDIDNILNNIKLGFDVEVDVWKIKDSFYIGHDSPVQKIDFDFLRNNKLWCHAKNIQSLEEMLKNNEINCFWHQNDDYTLTSKNFIWVYPNIHLPPNSIAVMPEISSYTQEQLKQCYAICTDKVLYYKKLLGE